MSDIMTLRFEELEAHGIDLSGIFQGASIHYNEFRQAQFQQNLVGQQQQQQSSFKSARFFLPGDIGELTEMFQIGRGYGLGPRHPQIQQYQAACAAMTCAIKEKTGLEIHVT